MRIRFPKAIRTSFKVNFGTCNLPYAHINFKLPLIPMKISGRCYIEVFQCLQKMVPEKNFKDKKTEFSYPMIFCS